MEKIEEISLLESFHFDDEILMEPENSFTSLLFHSPLEIILQNSSSSVKQELVESVFLDPINSKKMKRKCQEYNKNKSSPKKKKRAVKVSEDREKLPYVHVRARRGEATDSHSLAERARREKINARMKLLQNLVPGCNKVSSTLVVLEEIINLVQSLQLQVEFLSMKLAALQPKIDINLESLFSSESGSPLDYNFTSKVSPSWCVNQQVNENTQQIWHPDGLLSSGNFGESLKHAFPFLSK